LGGRILRRIGLGTAAIAFAVGFAAQSSAQGTGKRATASCTAMLQQRFGAMPGSVALGTSAPAGRRAYEIEGTIDTSLREDIPFLCRTQSGRVVAITLDGKEQPIAPATTP
jgi:hypothetical protein